VLAEIDDLDKARAAVLVPEDEAPIREAYQQVVNVLLVVGEDFRLDTARAIFHTTGTIRQRPQPGEEESRRHWQLSKVVVREESGFQ
jgi:hypothetical protein